MDTLKENIQYFSRQAAQLSHDANVAFSQGDFTKGRQLMKQAVEARDVVEILSINTHDDAYKSAERRVD